MRRPGDFFSLPQAASPQTDSPVQGEANCFIRLKCSPKLNQAPGRATGLAEQAIGLWIVDKPFVPFGDRVSTEASSPLQTYIGHLAGGIGPRGTFGRSGWLWECPGNSAHGSSPDSLSRTAGRQDYADLRVSLDNWNL